MTLYTLLHLDVSAVEPESSGDVIERSGRFPLLGSMTGLAGQLSLVRVLVAGVAGAIGEVKLARVGERLMAIAASDSGVLPSEGKLRLRMALHGKCVGLETRRGVALVAAILEWRGGELLVVLVLVACRANQLASLVDGGFALGLMTLYAREVRMFALQREGAFVVGCTIEASWFVPALGVTGRAIGSGRAFGKLSVVLILVTILAVLMGDRAMEIGGLVAGGTL